jgi:sulfatase maturation enzyme AslB (radical SAM superfamily)
MPSVETESNESSPTFRLDVPLHSLLTQPGSRAAVLPLLKPERLREPVFPQHPELLGDDGLGPPMPPPKRHHKAEHIKRALRGWAVPWLKSRVLAGDFHPIVAYLFTEWKCNLDCHYCWAFDNRVKGMTEEIAKRSIDWLHDSGAGVLALMGGEPLLRPQFAQKVCYYAAKKGLWIYVPTNARLLRPQVTD